MIEPGAADEGENIRVVVRIRPMNLSEKKEGDFSCVESTLQSWLVQLC
jgi:hypothetical protein